MILIWYIIPFKDCCTQVKISEWNEYFLHFDMSIFVYYILRNFVPLFKKRKELKLTLPLQQWSLLQEKKLIRSLWNVWVFFCIPLSHRSVILGNDQVHKPSYHNSVPYHESTPIYSDLSFINAMSFWVSFFSPLAEYVRSQTLNLFGTR